MGGASMAVVVHQGHFTYIRREDLTGFDPVLSHVHIVSVVIRALTHTHP